MLPLHGLCIWDCSKRGAFDQKQNLTAVNCLAVHKQTQVLCHQLSLPSSPVVVRGMQCPRKALLQQGSAPGLLASPGIAVGVHQHSSMFGHSGKLWQGTSDRGYGTLGLPAGSLRPALVSSAPQVNAEGAGMVAEPAYQS